MSWQALVRLLNQFVRGTIPIGYVKKSNIKLESIIALTIDTNDWRTPIIACIRVEVLPDDKLEAHKLRTKATHSSLVDGVLYRRSFNGPYARCLGKQEATYVLKKLHEGECGNHSG